LPALSADKQAQKSFFQHTIFGIRLLGVSRLIFGLLQSFFMFSYVSGSNSFQKPLNSEEEKYYLEEYQKGNLEAKNVLIERNLRLVAHIAKKYQNSVKDGEDLISVGTIGLIKAIVTFKAQRGTKLATYASKCIENELLMFLRSTKKYNNDVFLQDPIGVDREGNEVTLEDKLADENEPVDEQVDMKMKTHMLYQLIEKVLKVRERKIIELRYGLVTGEEVTQREIAEMMGISRSYVSRIEKKALNKLSKEIDQ
jgi:RNA polymerase sporulation-specific sigma factor